MHKYKNIVLFWDNGWQADYSDNGKRFALHRCCCRTKKSAYVIAKEEVDFLSERSAEYGTENMKISFEVYCNKEETMEINDFLDKLARPEEKYVNIETGDVYIESEIRRLYEELKADWSATEKEIYADFDYWLNSALDRNGSLRRI